MSSHELLQHDFPGAPRDPVRQGARHRRRRHDRLEPRRPAGRARAPRRSSSSTTSSAAAARTSPGREPTDRSTRRRGRHPRPRARARADERHRRRLPPGGDPHHPVRRGAAAGARGAGRRHLQRRRGGRRGRRPQGRRRLVGVGLRPRRGVPDARGPPPLRQRHPLRRGQGLQRGAAAQLPRDVRARLRRAALLQRLRPADGHPRRLHRGARPLDGADRRRRAAADPRRRPADDGLRLRRRHRPREPRWRPRATSPTRSSTSPAATRRACSSWPRRCCG